MGLAAAAGRTPRWHGWRRPLSRRNQKGDFNWERMTKLADDQLRNRGSFTLGRASDSPSSTRGKSRMHKGARTDLCGGRGVTRAPTATRNEIDLTLNDGRSLLDEPEGLAVSTRKAPAQ